MTPAHGTAALDLFSFPREAPSVAVDTSCDAAIAITDRTTTLRRQVFDAIAAAAGLTCEEVCDRLTLPGNTVRPRLCELEGQGLIEKSAAKRPTRSGRDARIYVVTAKGRRAR